MRDLELMQGILHKAKQGIDMNLLAFRLPDCIYYSDVRIFLHGISML